MTQLEWQQLEATVAGMTDAERQRLAMLLESNRQAASASADNPSLGLFADEPELIDEIMKGVYEARETYPLRTGE
jgi:hypothetical protein